MTRFARFRRQQTSQDEGGEKHQAESIPSPDQPPSYEDTMKTGSAGGAGGFVDPGLPVKTIVQVIQVCYDEFLRVSGKNNYHYQLSLDFTILLL